MSKIVTTPTLARHAWTWSYKRPARMGWPTIEIPNWLNRDRPHRMAPLEVSITVQQNRHHTEPTATTVRFKTGSKSPHWLSLHLPGTERYPSHYADVPDWMMEIVSDAVRASVATTQGGER